jgi:hypothetical protein
MIWGATGNMAKSESDRGLNLKEVRLIADLRIMHAKVFELFEIVSVIKRQHDESSIRKYADHMMLDQDIQRVDEMYLWFLKIKEEGLRLAKK